VRQTSEKIGVRICHDRPEYNIILQLFKFS